MRRRKKAIITAIAVTTISFLVLFLINPEIVFYGTTPNQILSKIEKVEFDSEHISQARYMVSFTDDMTFKYETIDTNQSELLNLTSKLIEDANDFDLEFSGGFPSGGFPLISIIVQNDNDDIIMIKLYGNRDTLSTLNKVIIRHENNSEDYSRTIEFEIAEDDFTGLYNLFYTE